jgi:hypothetical protein
MADQIVSNKQTHAMPFDMDRTIYQLTLQQDGKRMQTREWSWEISMQVWYQIPLGYRQGKMSLLEKGKAEIGGSH